MGRKKEELVKGTAVPELTVIRPEVLAKVEFKTMDDYDKMVVHYKGRMRQCDSAAVRIHWELGAHVTDLKEKGKYGARSVKDFAESLGTTDKWLYEVALLYTTYSWEEIEKKFIAAGVKPYAICRLATITDKVVRAQLEQKLLSGEIGPGDINEAKKLIEGPKAPKEPKTPPADEIIDGDADEDANADGTAEKAEGDDEPAPMRFKGQAGDELKDSGEMSGDAATRIRNALAKAEDVAGIMIDRLGSVEQALQDLDTIEDDATIDSVMSRMASCYDTLNKLYVRTLGTVNNIKKRMI